VGGACDATQWPIMSIRRLPRCVAVSFFTWCGACRRIMVELLLVIDCLRFFFLFSLLTTKVHNFPLCLLFVNFSPHSLNFLFHPYSFYRSFFFSILSFNYNFLYVLFFILVPILLIYYFVFIPF